MTANPNRHRILLLALVAAAAGTGCHKLFRSPPRPTVPPAEAAHRSGTRNDPAGFEAQGFLEGVDKDGYVEFDQLGKWHRNLFGRLRPSDVRWTCQRLARITPRQWDDAFRAGAYEADAAARFIAQIRRRVEAGSALSDRPAGE